MNSVNKGEALLPRKGKIIGEQLCRWGKCPKICRWGKCPKTLCSQRNICFACSNSLRWALNLHMYSLLAQPEKKSVCGNTPTHPPKEDWSMLPFGAGIWGRNGTFHCWGVSAVTNSDHSHLSIIITDGQAGLEEKETIKKKHLHRQ